MTFKALAIDLDGTLLIGEELSTRNRDAVRQAHAAGFEIIIATARWRQMAEEIAAQIGISKPIIACSGAQVFIPDENRDIFDHRIPPAFVEALYHLCNDMRCIATITLDQDVLIKMDGPPDASMLPDGLIWVPELSASDHSRPRVAAIQGSNIIREIRQNLFPGFADVVNIYDSIGPNGKIIITITAHSANKGKALLASCHYLDIEPGSVVAFGDAENDIEMFKVAGASVAMGQADELVKAAATTSTASNVEDGVALAIDRLLKTGQP